MRHAGRAHICIFRIAIINFWRLHIFMLRRGGNRLHKKSGGISRRL
jgi:hypothetical protein